MDIFDFDLQRNEANHRPLTPVSFLERAAATFPDHTAIIYGNKRTTYKEYWCRSIRLASALSAAGITKGDTVSVMLSNTPPMLEAHFGVPMAGGVLHSLNTRLDAATIAFQLDHSKSKVIIVDREFSAIISDALSQSIERPLVIEFDDPQHGADSPYPKAAAISSNDYEEFVSSGDETFAWYRPEDEWETIALNYTSGTTGNPKGVLYHHRGAALMAYNNTIHAQLDRHCVYLWTLPMFHCNGWCFPWTLALQAGTHVCLRWVRAKSIYDAIADHSVTHLCGAPVVMSILLDASQEERRIFNHKVLFNTAAAPPPSSIVSGMNEAGFSITHLYGLTETYGPSVVNEWKREWSSLNSEDLVKFQTRQGVRYAALDDLQVMDPDTMTKTPHDGVTLGEVMFRGNIVMKGYLNNPVATEEAFRGGWFHSGDLAVMHPDGYIELKDRSKDIIISGGENISSIEVEEVLYKHPAVSSCCVVARSDERWGEVPVAFVELRQQTDATEQEILDHCRKNLARFKCPRSIIFDEIPKTSTGKIQKFKLRDTFKSS